MKKRRARIGLCTGGGDCPGLNAAIRAVVRYAELGHGLEVLGIPDGLTGLLGPLSSMQPLSVAQVDPILVTGGTILGTSSQGSPFANKDAVAQLLAQMKSAVRQLKLDGIVAIGGDGSHFMAKQLAASGVRIVGIPKTIDNDLIGTEQTIGFATAVDLATDAACRLGSSAAAHHRIMILEVMGRDAGHIALATALASGAQAVLVPEVPFSLDTLTAHVLASKNTGHRGYLIVAAEGAFESGADQLFQQSVSGSKLLGGIGAQVARTLHDRTGLDARVAVLGHVQRGGPPNAADRILAAGFARHAIDLVVAESYGRIVAIRRGRPAEISYDSINAKRRVLAANDPQLQTAEALGITLGRP